MFSAPSLVTATAAAGIPTAGVLAAALSGIATLAGALPVVALAPFGRRFYDIVLGFGAGQMMAAATVGLLGHAYAESGDGHRFWPLSLGFLAGVAVMYLMERLIPHLHAQGHADHLAGHADHAGDHAAHGADHAGDADATRKGLLIAGAMGLHRIPEGFAIGAGYMLGDGKLGIYLALAVGIQNVCEGMFLSVPLRRGGLSRGRTLTTAIVTGAITPIGAVLGMLFFRHMAGTLPVGLALAAGALLYLVLTEIIPESHSHGNEKAASLALAAGFGVSLGLHSLVGH